ncbi:MAG: two-component system, OmpR family, phosphate regulon sensor histidine kinase PhoR [Eubacteriales bacterium]|nr:two-component system, OmpR family, phosphate regulon sensor histidine kinase PhoR [Eubacteriales bacterium]
MKLESKTAVKIVALMALLFFLGGFLLSPLRVWDFLQISKQVAEISVFLVLLLSFFVVYRVVREVMEPLRRITEVAQRMAEGDLEQEIRISSRDEIGILAASLNNMARRLKENIDQITEERNKLAAILSSMDEGVLAIDRQGNIILINPVVEKLFRVTAEEAVGRNVIEVIRNYELERLIRKALEENIHQAVEMSFLMPDPRIFRVQLVPLRRGEEMAGIVVVLRDISELRRLEQMRSEFVANVSHELRMPLTSIRGFTETLLDGALEDPTVARHFLQIIHDEAERLTRLINDLLSLSALESRRREPNRKLLDWHRLVGEVVSMLAPLVQGKNLEVEVKVAEDLPPVPADRDMMGQMLINLLDNAIKYTPDGGKIKVAVWGEGDNLVLQVADTGIGIPPESLPRIFERFYRADKARSRELGGTGLGLAIVKHIVEAHGGRIEVESRVNGGTSFTVYLPPVAE